MLRQLIEQLQDQLFQLRQQQHHRRSLDPSQLVLLQPPPHHHHEINSPGFVNLDSVSENSGCYNLVLMADKSESTKILDPFHPPAAKTSRRRAGGSTYRSKMMDQEIWKEFPDDLFEAVIARLPVPTFFRFRSVCRKWNSMLTSSSFSQQCDLVNPSQPWFYTITHDNNGGAMYDPSSRKWHHVVLPPQPAKNFRLPVASAGGLVCCLDIGHRNFQVLNPLTHSYKELPPRSAKVWSQVAVGMTSDGNSSTRGYKILWLNCGGEHEIYDSEKDSWYCPGSMMSSVILPLCLNFQSHTISIGDILYFMRTEPDGIVSYNMASGVWQQFIIPAPPQIMDHTLAECEGRVMLVGLLTKNAATCVCVWELQKMTLLWKEVDRMPNIWCLEFYGKHVRMTCLGNRGVLLVSLRSRQVNRLVSYNILTREWQKIPGWRHRKRYWIPRGTSFLPHPTALV